MESENPVLSTGLYKTLQKYPELRALVTVWPGLPEEAKTAIQTLIETKKVEQTLRP